MPQWRALTSSLWHRARGVKSRRDGAAMAPEARLARQHLAPLLSAAHQYASSACCGALRAYAGRHGAHIMCGCCQAAANKVRGDLVVAGGDFDGVRRAWAFPGDDFAATWQATRPSIAWRRAPRRRPGHLQTRRRLSSWRSTRRITRRAIVGSSKGVCMPSAYRRRFLLIKRLRLSRFARLLSPSRLWHNIL